MSALARLLREVEAEAIAQDQRDPSAWENEALNVHHSVRDIANLAELVNEVNERLDVGRHDEARAVLVFLAAAVLAEIAALDGEGEPTLSRRAGDEDDDAKPKVGSADDLEGVMAAVRAKVEAMRKSRGARHPDLRGNVEYEEGSIGSLSTVANEAMENDDLGAARERQSCLVLLAAGAINELVNDDSLDGEPDGEDVDHDERCDDEECRGECLDDTEEDLEVGA